MADQREPVTWGEFSALQPELAAFGAARLTGAPAYFGTIRPSGAPRVRPVTPIITNDGLFLYMEPTSPKARDLRECDRFSLHNGVPDDAGTGGEFNVEGRAVSVDERNIWDGVAEASSYVPAERYILFELLLTEARCHGYGDVELPPTRNWSVFR